VFKGWYKEPELTNEMNSYTLVTQNLTLYAKWEASTFANESWENIKINLATNRNYYPIGSTKLIQMDMDNDGIDEYYNLRLVNTEPCGETTVSRTSCGVVIEFITSLGTTEINSTNTNAGGWYASDLRKKLNPRTETNTNNNSIFSKLPTDLQNVIIDTAPIISGSGSGGVSNDVVAIGDFKGDKLFLQSPKELGSGVDTDNRKTEGYVKTLKYYVDNSTQSYRTKYKSANSTGVNSSTNVSYWTRTAVSDKSNNFTYIDYTGLTKYSSEATHQLYCLPAFRILD
jgi:uncharacterized repeat protein (TIGR02543 family)